MFLCILCGEPASRSVVHIGQKQYRCDSCDDRIRAALTERDVAYARAYFRWEIDILSRANGHPLNKLAYANLRRAQHDAEGRLAVKLIRKAE